MYFLSDRRQKLTGAISSLSDPLPAESTIPPLSSLSGEDLHSIPSIPMAEYEPEQLLRIAQVIYTALIKVYLVARPVLVGSLCRIENWCDVEEVEELLKEKKVSLSSIAMLVIDARNSVISWTCTKARKCTQRRWRCCTSEQNRFTRCND